MICLTGSWKMILFAAVAAVLTYGVPASALVTVPSGTSVTFAWAPAFGNVAGYDVLVDSVGKPTILYSTVVGRTSESVTAALDETITIRVVAFDASNAYGAPSSPSEAVLFASAGGVGAPKPIVFGKASDIDSDGVSDIIAQSSRKGYLEVTSMDTGETMLLLKCRQRSNGTSKCKPIKMNGKRWMIVGNGDYDGDGISDLLFRTHRKGVQKTTSVRVFFMNGDRIRDIVKLTTEVCKQRRDGSSKCRFKKTRVKKYWQIVGSADYNGDGLSDVLLHNALENKFDIWSMRKDGSPDGATYESEILPDDFGSAPKVIASGDFDGDGMSDILWRDLESGDVDIWGLTKNSTLGPLEGGSDPWGAIGAGDFDGDGSDDVLLREADTDRLAVRLSTTGVRGVIASAQKQGASVPLNQGARERQVPSIGDYDGDGLSDLVIYDSQAVETRLWLMQGSTITASELLPSLVERWDYATVDLRPPGSR
jgi:hypothetical protein